MRLLRMAERRLYMLEAEKIIRDVRIKNRGLSLMDAEFIVIPSASAFPPEANHPILSMT